MNKSRLLAGAVALLIIPCAAQAHILFTPAIGFASGFAHPLSGIDHTLAMLAVGIWASQRGARATLSFPLAFLGVMTAAAAVAISVGRLPGIEAAIASSLVGLGLAVALAIRPPAKVCFMLIGLFATFHGYSHGAELPLSVSALDYGAGFIAATSLLLGVGVAIGEVCRLLSLQRALRVAGGVITLAGVGMLLTT